ncbi:ENR1 protein, partial [Caloenas nicobarica]|nr:ENR1 protein [Caloenas nicobarica]
LQDHPMQEIKTNLFLNLMEEIARELNVTSCWVCGGVQMMEQWPWRGESLTPDQLLEWNNTYTSKIMRPDGWALTNEVIGQYCISRKS